MIARNQDRFSVVEMRHELVRIVEIVLAVNHKDRDCEAGQVGGRDLGIDGPEKPRGDCESIRAHFVRKGPVKRRFPWTVRKHALGTRAVRIGRDILQAYSIQGQSLDAMIPQCGFDGGIAAV